MFAAQCAGCGKRRLMSLSSMIAVDNHQPGCIDVTYECPCGGTGIWTTGRNAN